MEPTAAPCEHSAGVFEVGDDTGELGGVIYNGPLGRTGHARSRAGVDGEGDDVSLGGPAVEQVAV